MRQVGVNGNVSALGPPFWLNRTVPSYCTDTRTAECAFPTYLAMDAQTRRDAEQLLASFVRTTVEYPDVSAGKAPDLATVSKDGMVYNERSLYRIPTTGALMLLLRGVGSCTHSGADVQMLNASAEIWTRNNSGVCFNYVIGAGVACA